ncbi:MAG: AraC family ligand binding domain-containing protein [Spirochaetota bacterium]
MAIYIDTKACEKIALGKAQGVVAEIMNKELCGAETGIASLRWLGTEERFQTPENFPGIQLLYIIEGEASVSLAGNHYDLEKGSGVYLEQNETVSVQNLQQEVLNILHIEVPHKPSENNAS